MQSGTVVCCNATIPDALLIAAAPDLAVALRLARVFADKAERSPWQQQQLAIIDAALTKAGVA